MEQVNEAIDCTVNTELSDPMTWLSSYILWSFYFSQGNPSLQYRLDTYMVKNFDNQVTVLPERTDELKADAAAKIGDFILSPGRHVIIGSSRSQKTVINKEVYNRISAIQNLVDTHPHTDIRPLELMRIMIERDKQLLFMSQGRSATRTEPEHPRYGRSLMLEHLIGGKDTYHEVFRSLFQQASRDMIEHFDPQDVENLRMLNERQAHLRRTPLYDVDAFFEQHFDSPIN